MKDARRCRRRAPPEKVREPPSERIPSLSSTRGERLADTASAEEKGKSDNKRDRSDFAVPL